MKQYIIEARNPDGSLDLKCEQPETVFGRKSISGMTLNEIAKTIFRFKPDAVLDGGSIPLWATAINPKWVIREKTW